MSNFLNELKRRNIFKVAIAYIIIAWLIVQLVGDMATGPMAMPFTLVMLIVGLPVILVLSWAFEITPVGISRSDQVDPDQSIAPKTGQRIDKIIFAAVALAVFYFFFTKNGM